MKWSSHAFRHLFDTPFPSIYKQNNPFSLKTPPHSHNPNQGKYTALRKGLRFANILDRASIFFFKTFSIEIIKVRYVHIVLHNVEYVNVFYFNWIIIGYFEINETWQLLKM